MSAFTFVFVRSPVIFHPELLQVAAIMKSIAKMLFVAPIVFLMATPVLALDDTSANRREQADNYMRAVPPQSLLKDMTMKIAATIPESQRATFIILMNKNLDVNTLAE